MKHSPSWEAVFLMNSSNSRIFGNRKVTGLNLCYTVLLVLISYTEAVSAGTEPMETW
jgi:hypothetical protein